MVPRGSGTDGHDRNLAVCFGAGSSMATGQMEAAQVKTPLLEYLEKQERHEAFLQLLIRLLRERLPTEVGNELEEKARREIFEREGVKP